MNEIILSLFHYLLLVIDCRLPLDVNNGFYKLTNKTTYFGSTVTYECNRNYNLIGNKTRTCTEFGVWSGQDPSCESMHQ